MGPSKSQFSSLRKVIGVVSHRAVSLRRSQFRPHFLFVLASLGSVSGSTLSSVGFRRARESADVIRKRCNCHVIVGQVSTNLIWHDGNRVTTASQNVVRVSHGCKTDVAIRHRVVTSGFRKLDAPRVRDTVSRSFRCVRMQYRVHKADRRMTSPVCSFGHQRLNMDHGSEGSSEPILRVRRGLI